MKQKYGPSSRINCSKCMKFLLNKISVIWKSNKANENVFEGKNEHSRQEKNVIIYQ